MGTFLVDSHQCHGHRMRFIVSGKILITFFDTHDILTQFYPIAHTAEWH